MRIEPKIRLPQSADQLQRDAAICQVAALFFILAFFVFYALAANGQRESRAFAGVCLGGACAFIAWSFLMVLRAMCSKSRPASYGWVVVALAIEALGALAFLSPKLAVAIQFFIASYWVYALGARANPRQNYAIPSLLLFVIGFIFIVWTLRMGL